MTDRDEKLKMAVQVIIIAAAITVLLLAASKLVSLLVLVFGAAVIGLLIRSFADLIEDHSPLSGGWSLAVALTVIVLVIGCLGWLFGSHVGGQFNQLAERFTEAWDWVEEQLRQSPAGSALLSSFDATAAGNSIISNIGRAAMSFVSALADFVLLIFGAVFIALNPALYLRGLVLLVPKDRRPVVEEALRDSGRAVKKWMAGQFVSMLIVGVLTGLGLWLVGVPSAIALGIVAGVSEIIPWLGPIIASVPALLIALTEGPQTALLTLVVLVVVQQIEGSIVMPVVQKKVVSLPPALTIFGVVAMGLLFGPVGLIFAAPLLVVAYVLVKRLYVQEALDTDTEIPGER